MSEDTTPGPEFYRRRYEGLRSQARAKAVSLSPPQAPAVVDEAGVRVRETIPGGWYWAGRVSRGETLRLVDVSGAASVSALFWNADDPTERYNAGDTVKVQWTSRLTTGRLLFSDMGRVLAAITGDTSGRHDALLGGSTRGTNAKTYGAGAGRNTRDNFILGAAKLGLGPRDIPGCITFFAPVETTTAAGQFTWQSNARPAGAFVDLRAEMNLLVVLSNCPHPMDPSPQYAPGQAEAIIWTSGVASADHYWRSATEEGARGFDNTDAYFRVGEWS